jgi:hypothetical protein
MVLRSERPGSHIPDPESILTLERFEVAIGRRLPRRVTLDDFIAYGVWYQKNAVPDMDGRWVSRVEADGSRFRVILDDGEKLLAKRVVVATGLEGYASRPAAFAQVPPDLAPHSYQVSTPSSFAGLRVAVIGSGQSALELAALLHEAGADVEIIIRRPVVRFLSGRDLFRHSPIGKLIYPPGEVGPPGINWIIELPDVFRSLPNSAQQWIFRQVTPIGAAWLRPRLVDVRVTAGRMVVSAVETMGHLELVLDDGSKRVVDRAVLGTGYRVAVDRHPVLAPSLTSALRLIDGSPELRHGFESSIPGLHFLGAAATKSFGPLMRFVAGAGYSARAVTCRITGLATRS